MTGKTHITGGCLTALVITTYMLRDSCSVEECTIAGALTVLGSIAPDIDEPNSKIGRLLPIVSIPYKVLGITLRIIGSILPWIGKPVKKLGNEFRHRHFTHSYKGLIVLLIMYAISTLFSRGVSYAVAGYIAGVVSHIILDRLNIIIKYNGVVESLLRYFLAAVSLVYLYLMFNEALHL